MLSASTVRFYCWSCFISIMCIFVLVWPHELNLQDKGWLVLLWGTQGICLDFAIMEPCYWCHLSPPMWSKIAGNPMFKHLNNYWNSIRFWYTLKLINSAYLCGRNCLLSTLTAVFMAFLIAEDSNGAIDQKEFKKCTSQLNI